LITCRGGFSLDTLWRCDDATEVGLQCIQAVSPQKWREGKKPK
jgi:hypothetical protein